jgi:hypothetical protein
MAQDEPLITRLRILIVAEVIICIQWERIIEYPYYLWYYSRNKVPIIRCNIRNIIAFYA